MAESVLNLACVGARPIAVVNCLNFGNPEHPEVMWQLSEAVDGMAEACNAFGLPVIGGNVSLYNESRGTDIDPTPVIGLLGMVDELDRRPARRHHGRRRSRSCCSATTSSDAAPSLAGSAAAWASGQKGGTLPAFDGVAHTAVADLVRSLVIEGALVRRARRLVGRPRRGPRRAHLPLRARPARHGRRHRRPALRRAPVAGGRRGARRCGRRRCSPERPSAGVAAVELGAAGGDRFTIDGLVDLPADEVRRRLARPPARRRSAPAPPRPDTGRGLGLRLRRGRVTPT